jgi:hypothetical protein
MDPGTSVPLVKQLMSAFPGFAGISLWDWSGDSLYMQGNYAQAIAQAMNVQPSPSPSPGPSPGPGPGGQCTGCESGTSGECKTKVTNLCYPELAGLCPGGTYHCKSTLLNEVDAVLRSETLPAEIIISDALLRDKKY